MPLFRCILLACLLFTGAHGVIAAPADNAVGMVLDLQGTGQVTDKGVVSKLQLLGYLKPQARIVLDPGSKASLSLYATRSTYQFTGPAVVDIGKDQLTVVQGKQPTVKSMSEKLVVAAETTNLTAGAYRLRSIAPRIVVVAPENGSVLLNNRVAFNWVAAEAAAFDISLRDEADKVIASAKPGDTTWQLPEGVVLDHGNTYYWTVAYKSAKDGKTYSATGEFSVAGKADIAAITELKPAQGAAIEEWILYAAMLQSRRFLQEARAVWQFIARQRPDLQSIQEMVQ